MKRFKSGVFMAILVGVAGCGGVSKGDKYHVSVELVYFDLKDTESGGPKDRVYLLVKNGRADYISNCGVKVLVPGKEWTKVEALNGPSQGIVGWMPTINLK